MSKTYSEKLKDPRWQKKRLEIMGQHNFCCEFCGEDKETLHVHHKRYIWELDPWEYENIDLLCLCETCHNQTHELKKYLDKIISYNHNANQPNTLDILLGYLKGMLIENWPYLIKIDNEYQARGFADYFQLPIANVLEEMMRNDAINHPEDVESMRGKKKLVRRKKKV